jgi:hypothetical protein
LEKWSNSKITAFVGVIGLFASILGGVLVSGAMYGKYNYAHSMIIERLDRHVGQIKEAEKRLDGVEKETFSVKSRLDDIWCLLSEVRNRQVTTSVIQKKNLGISSENNKILKNGGGIK